MHLQKNRINNSIQIWNFQIRRLMTWNRTCRSFTLMYQIPRNCLCSFNLRLKNLKWRHTEYGWSIMGRNSQKMWLSLRLIANISVTIFRLPPVSIILKSRLFIRLATFMVVSIALRHSSVSVRIKTKNWN